MCKDQMDNSNLCKVESFGEDKESEDTDCVFFDADGDVDRICLSLAAVMSSLQILQRSVAGLYFNKGNLRWQRSTQILPAGSLKVLQRLDASDLRHDGDVDLFVGVRVIPFLYGVPANGYILQNDGPWCVYGCHEATAEGLTGIGLITDAKWLDVNHDKRPDLLRCWRVDATSHCSLIKEISL
jgi:hypothetical protein